MTLHDWIKEQDTTDTHKLMVLATARPVTGYNDYDTEAPRDKLTVLADREAKSIAALASINKTDTPAEMDTKLQAYVDAAGTTVQTKLALYNASKFWTCFFAVQTTDGDQSDVIITPHHDPIYGDSPAQVNDWGAITGDVIEAAMRG